MRISARAENPLFEMLGTGNLYLSSPLLLPLSRVMHEMIRFQSTYQIPLPCVDNMS